MCYARRQRSSWARIKLSEKWYISNGEVSLSTQNINFRALIFVCSFYLNLPFVRVQKNCRDFLQVSFVSVSPILISVPHCTFLSISCCSIFKDHSCQGILSFPFAVTHTRLIYYIISWSVCQEVLQKFFKFFRTRLLFRFGLLRPFGRFWLTLILYHIFDRLSRGFAKVFSDFFQPPARRLRLADSLFSIPYLFRIVNSFRQIFRHDFHFWLYALFNIIIISRFVSFIHPMYPFHSIHNHDFLG